MKPQRPTPISRTDRINARARELIGHGIEPLAAVARATREIDEAMQRQDHPGWSGKRDPDTRVRFSTPLQRALTEMDVDHEAYVRERDARQRRDPFYCLGKSICGLMGW